MKRKDLIKEIEKSGCFLLRHGGKHDIYHNPVTGFTEPVPCHRDINEHLAHRILKRLSSNKSQ